jgi:3-hydroxy-9,10-secoandrosta-1,3,5(10)-triene-9,17-dione monooxygenase reductase component
LVLFVPAKTSRAWPAIQRSGKFCVNFLAADQAELSNQMASKGADKFAGVAWRPAPATGSPMIEGTLGYVDCQIQSAHEAGDHFVVVGRVLDLGAGSEDAGDAKRPLLFFEGKYSSTDG